MYNYDIESPSCGDCTHVGDVPSGTARFVVTKTTLGQQNCYRLLATAGKTQSLYTPQMCVLMPTAAEIEDATSGASGGSGGSGSSEAATAPCPPFEPMADKLSDTALALTWMLPSETPGRGGWPIFAGALRCPVCLSADITQTGVDAWGIQGNQCGECGETHSWAAWGALHTRDLLSFETPGRGGWPIIDGVLCCPVCLSTNITFTGSYAGVGTGPSGRGRLGDPGGLEINQCNECGEMHSWAAQTPDGVRW